ncbi:MAG: major facilitator superfamily protein [Sphingomonas bacterium]|nr:MFS transporter [Sphingomonas bacterium]MDB5690333.1 major facilitator superfamily protein [Sphingomonas bacterium]
MAGFDGAATIDRGTDPSRGGAARPPRAYQIGLVALLSINFGIVFFDRNSLNFLMPFVQPELGLTNTMVGVLAGAMSFTWALAAFGMGRLSDKLNSRKGLLILATIIFSVCSFLSGLAQSFALLLGARLLMGAAEGGIMPISQTMVAQAVDPKHRGVAMGVTQNFGSNLLGSFVAPVLLVAFAGTLGWRNTFYLAGVPGLITAALMWWYIRNDPPLPVEIATVDRPKSSLGAVFGDRNVMLCALIAIVLVSYFIITLAFLPIYLTGQRGYDPQTMSWLIGALGLSATANSFITPALSDRIGRKPLMIFAPILGVMIPLAAMYYHGPALLLGVIFGLGWALNGIFPMFMATIPSESVDARHAATAIGLCMGLGEFLGGVLSPALAGMLGDAFGLNAILWVLMALCLLGAALATGLRETAPRALARRGL